MGCRAGVLTQHWVPLLLLLSGPTEGRFHAAEPQKHPLLPAGASFLTLNLCWRTRREGGSCGLGYKAPQSHCCPEFPFPYCSAAVP